MTSPAPLGQAVRPRRGVAHRDARTRLLPPLVRGDQGGSLSDLKIRAGLSQADLVRITGIPRHRIRRALAASGRQRRHELTALRQAMQDVLRRQRSSDPEFLRQIQEAAVPFLRRQIETNPCR